MKCPHCRVEIHSKFASVHLTPPPTSKNYFSVQLGKDVGGHLTSSPAARWSVSKPTEFWLWWVVDVAIGKRRRTSYRMTREEAQQRHPGAEPVPGTVETRNLPGTDA